MLYAIIHELKNKNKIYTSLFEKIKNYGSWMHYIDNLWIIESTKKSEEIYSDLKPHIDQKQDYILVIRVESDYYGLLPKDAWEWIQERSF